MRWIILGLGLVFWAISPSAAQGGAVIDLDGYSVELPAGWKAPTDYAAIYTMDDAIQPVVVLYETGLEGLLVSPTQVDDLLNGLEVLGLDIALAELIEVAYGFEVGLDEIETAGLGAVEGVHWSYSEDDSIVGDIYLIPLAGGGYLFADLYVNTEIFFADIQAHLSHSERLFTSAGASLLGTSNCEVSASAGMSVPVRAWPDPDRTALMRLPLDQPVTVIARWVNSDSVWYQLDEDQLNPPIDADSFWVAQADVDEQGTCDRVRLADLNPIVSGTTDPELLAILPQSGVWFMEYDSTIRLVCEGQPDDIWDTEEFFSDISAYVPIITTENTLRLPEGTLDRIEPGRYTGRSRLYGLTAHYDLSVINTQSMAGEIAIEIEEADCVVMMDVTLTRR